MLVLHIPNNLHLEPSKVIFLQESRAEKFSAFTETVMASAKMHVRAKWQYSSCAIKLAALSVFDSQPICAKFANTYCIFIAIAIAHVVVVIVSIIWLCILKTRLIVKRTCFICSLLSLKFRLFTCFTKLRICFRGVNWFSTFIILRIKFVGSVCGELFLSFRFYYFLIVVVFVWALLCVPL